MQHQVTSIDLHDLSTICVSIAGRGGGLLATAEAKKAAEKR